MGAEISTFVAGGGTALNTVQVDAFLAAYNATDPPLTITGPSTVCSSGNYQYTLSGVPPGATVNWSVSPSSLVTPSTGTGTTFTTHAINGSVSGSITITASVSGTCQVVGTKPSIWVGLVSFTNPTIDDQTYYTGSCYGVCPGYHWAEVTINGIDPQNLGWTLTPAGDVNWQWDYIDSEIVFEVIPYYTTFPFYFKPAANACGTSTFQFCLISGPNCQQGFAYSMSPNPSSNTLTLVRKNGMDQASTQAEIMIYDSSMKVVYQEVTASTTITIDTSGFKEGSYIVRIIDDNGTSEDQLLIQR